MVQLFLIKGQKLLDGIVGGTEFCFDLRINFKKIIFSFIFLLKSLYSCKYGFLFALTHADKC